MTLNEIAKKDHDINHRPCQKSGSIHERIPSFNLPRADYYYARPPWINKVSNTQRPSNRSAYDLQDVPGDISVLRVPSRYLGKCCTLQQVILIPLHIFIIKASSVKGKSGGEVKGCKVTAAETQARKADIYTCNATWTFPDITQQAWQCICLSFPVSSLDFDVM